MGDGVVWAPHVGGPIGDTPTSILVFLNNDGALGERVVRDLLVGSDEVDTQPSSPLPFGR